MFASALVNMHCTQVSHSRIMNETMGLYDEYIRRCMITCKVSDLLPLHGRYGKGLSGLQNNLTLLGLKQKLINPHLTKWEYHAHYTTLNSMV